MVPGADWLHAQGVMAKGAAARTGAVRLTTVFTMPRTTGDSLHSLNKVYGENALVMR
jgi:hypothetical protein